MQILHELAQVRSGICKTGDVMINQIKQSISMSATIFF